MGWGGRCGEGDQGLAFSTFPGGACWGWETRKSSRQKWSGGRVLSTPFEPAMPDAGPIPGFFLT